MGELPETCQPSCLTLPDIKGQKSCPCRRLQGPSQAKTSPCVSIVSRRSAQAELSPLFHLLRH